MHIVFMKYYAYMPYFSWAILGFFLGQLTFFWDKYCKILGHFQGHFASAK